MTETITPAKTEMGWVMEIPAEMAAILKVPPGSFAVLYPKEGGIETEILPPPSDELKEDFERLFNKYRETCEELKRIGD
jgi:hypothetical protein